MRIRCASSYVYDYSSDTPLILEVKMIVTFLVAQARKYNRYWMVVRAHKDALKIYHHESGNACSPGDDLPMRLLFKIEAMGIMTIPHNWQPYHYVTWSKVCRLVLLSFIYLKCDSFNVNKLKAMTCVWKSCYSTLMKKFAMLNANKKKHKVYSPICEQ